MLASDRWAAFPQLSALSVVVVVVVVVVDAAAAVGGSFAGAAFVVQTFL